jgi:hypothetical protein
LKCLEYVSETPDIIENNVPVYIFCDGGVDATQKENADIIAKYPFVTETFYQSENLCIAKHIHYVRETVFDKMKYDRIMFLDDDVVVSPYYYRFMNRVLDFYDLTDSTVGMVNSCLICHEPLSRKIETQFNFWDIGLHINNHIMLKKTWNTIKPTMEEYMEKFIIPASDYRKVDYESVIKWARNKLSESPSPQATNKTTNAYLCGSQDSITNMSMRINNIRYVSSYVNRVIYIGEYGYHTYEEPQMFKKFRFDKVVLDIMSNDAYEITKIYEHIII